MRLPHILSFRIDTVAVRTFASAPFFNFDYTWRIPRTSVKMATPVIIKDFSRYTDEKPVKTLKNSSDSLKWKTHVDSVKETIIAFNKTLSDEKSSKVSEQPVGEKFTALGMLFEEFCRLEAKMKELQ